MRTLPALFLIVVVGLWTKQQQRRYWNFAFAAWALHWLTLSLFEWSGVRIAGWRWLPALALGGLAPLAILRRGYARSTPTAPVSAPADVSALRVERARRAEPAEPAA